MGLFAQGLDDFSLSRESVKWGIPVPFNKQQVIYVWVEALLNYLTALGYGSQNEKNFKKFWPADLHLMGKEIIKFHVIYWPAMLLAAGLPVPRKIFAHGFFTVDGQKMSKTLGNVINPHDLVSKYGSDAARYLILSQFPFGQDGDIKAEKFVEQYNDQLANNLGNMFSRVMKLAQDIKAEKLVGGTEQEKEISGRLQKTWVVYEQAMANLQIDQGLNAVRSLIDFGNKYINETKPWELKKNDPRRFITVMLGLLEMLRHLTWLIQPFLPATAEKMLVQLGVVDDKKLPYEQIKQWREFDSSGIKEGVSLFPRI